MNGSAMYIFGTAANMAMVLATLVSFLIDMHRDREDGFYAGHVFLLIMFMVAFGVCMGHLSN